MTTYIVRRGRDGGGAIRREDSEIFINDETVSGVHGEIVDCGGGRYEFSDNNSTNGTFIRESRGWVRVRTVELTESDEIKLGSFVTRLGDLVGSANLPRERVKISRNPETGEIIEKKWR
jgi:pSer/pThr/pTyr-binding forkhead associated (FHA) protein